MPLVGIQGAAPATVKALTEVAVEGTSVKVTQLLQVMPVAGMKGTTEPLPDKEGVV
jgi:hypothetical protein